jgi:hypothetical protein
VFIKLYSEKPFEAEPIKFIKGETSHIPERTFPLVERANTISGPIEETLDKFNSVLSGLPELIKGLDERIKQVEKQTEKQVNNVGRC